MAKEKTLKAIDNAYDDGKIDIVYSFYK